MQTFADLGLGERCFRGRGEVDLERRDLRYLSREREREELLPLLLLLSLLDDLDRDLLLPCFVAAGPRVRGDGLPGLVTLREALESVVLFLGIFSRLPRLDELLLREELPDELDRLEPEELERDPELELLLPDEELLERLLLL